jgi:hypothetical protein
MKREKETEEYRATVIILRNNGTHIFIKSLLLRSKKKERKKEREREREREEKVQSVNQSDDPHHQTRRSSF